MRFKVLHRRSMSKTIHKTTTRIIFNLSHENIYVDIFEVREWSYRELACYFSRKGVHLNTAQNLTKMDILLLRYGPDFCFLVCDTLQVCRYTQFVRNCCRYSVLRKFWSWRSAYTASQPIISIIQAHQTENLTSFTKIWRFQWSRI